MLRTTLESVGYVVREADDGEAALAQLGRMKPGCDLILLDLKMPKMDGMELLARLRGQGHAAPVVMLTAHGSIPDAVAAMKMGAIDFLTKPVTPEALRRVVAEVIGRHAAPSAPAPPAQPRLAPEDRTELVASHLRQAKRALNRGEFREADSLLRKVVALDPGSSEAPELLKRLHALEDQDNRARTASCGTGFPAAGPEGNDRPLDARTWVMTALLTLALGLALFGLFFALVVGCDHL
jgi:DNA-binding response OmpR family regulator